MERIQVKYRGQLMSYATEQSSGMDVVATFKSPNEIEFYEGGLTIVDGGVMVSPGSRFAVPTGLYFEIPEGFEAQVRSRSGLSLKQGLAVVQAPGTIDADYRGEVKVCLINLSKMHQFIPFNARIAQIVFARVAKATMEEVDSFTETKRGAGGFGHTGVL